jgi:GTP cyclohydrolase I
MQDLIRKLLEKLGDDPEREGLIKTPERVSRMYEFLTAGYRTSLDSIVNGAIFEEDYDEMVCVTDIRFYSLCEHHLLPFFGRAHVGYIPDGRLIGLSKIPRIVDMFAHRLQLQERLTQQIAQSIADVLNPRGVGVVLEAEHLCMQMRGVQKQDSFAITSAMRGVFKENARTRSEFMSLIHHPNP